MACFKTGRFESLKSFTLRKTILEVYSKNVNSIILRRKTSDTRSHYEVLNLKENCTAKNIRDAFIKLSKENHPDRNQNDPKLHEKFVRINEAYSVLSQPNLRLQYDLSRPKKVKEGSFVTRSRVQRPLKSDGDIIMQEILKRAKENKDNVDKENFYGVPGIEKKSNSIIAIVLLALSLAGGILQFFFINYSNTASQKNFMEKSKLYQQLLNDLQEKAQREGNEVQFEKLQKSMQEATQEK